MATEKGRVGTLQYLGLGCLNPQELVRGFVRDAPAPSVLHQEAVFQFTLALRTHVRELDLGTVVSAPVDVILDEEEGLVMQPDVVYVAHERETIVGDCIWGPPDLVIDILSPRPRIGSYAERVEWFARYSVGECWVFRQYDRELDVLTLQGGRITDRRTFAGWEPIRSAVLPFWTQSVSHVLQL